jgi:hypothetical protein
MQKIGNRKVIKPGAKIDQVTAIARTLIVIHIQLSINFKEGGLFIPEW